MGKVILSVEQNKALRQLKSLRWPKENILGQHIKGWVYPEHQCLKGLSFTELETVINVPDSYVVVNKSEELKEFEMATKPLGDMLDSFRYGAAMMLDKKLEESIKIMADGEVNPVKAIMREPLQPTKAEVDQVAKNNEHLDHPFYKKVDEITEKVAMQQILKGAEKYDEPFNPDSWTGEELGNHALEELRDGQVYVVGMVEKIKGLEQENRILKNEIEALELENDRLDRLNKERMKELREMAEKGKAFTPTITVNLNGNVDPDFDGVKVAEQLAEQIKKGLSSL